MKVWFGKMVCVEVLPSVCARTLGPADRSLACYIRHHAALGVVSARARGVLSGGARWVQGV